MIMMLAVAVLRVFHDPGDLWYTGVHQRSVIMKNRWRQRQLRMITETSGRCAALSRHAALDVSDLIADRAPVSEPGPIRSRLGDDTTGHGGGACHGGPDPQEVNVK
ncbi:hypothetical protein [Dactylosporangium sp. CA-092794]|uniref:hypothetical protein n=1 Tax=Dactylosporangium sp. CA-092794 TaxID=3239929 RepID=UPI003D8BE9C0